MPPDREAVRSRPAGRTGGPPSPLRAVCRPACAVATAFLASACSGGVLDAQGPIGGAESVIMIDAVVIMLAIIVPTMVATVAFAWWYRASNPKATYRPDWAYSGRVELVIWSVPLLTIVFLGSICWISSHALDPALPIASAKKPVEVQVVSLDWRWLFIYPDQGIASINRVVVPTGTPVHFALTSSGVWNSFFVPQLGSSIYTMKGMTTELNLVADRDGDYHGLSTHFSGDGFSDMGFQFQAVPDAAFADWVGRAKASGPALDEPAYVALERQSTDEAPRTYAGIAPDLFSRIVTEKVPAGPGPALPSAAGAPTDVVPKGGT